MDTREEYSRKPERSRDDRCDEPPAGGPVTVGIGDNRIGNMHKTNLTNDQRRAVWDILLTKRRADDQSKLIPSAAREVGLQFNVASTTIRDIFKSGQTSLAAGNLVADVSAHKRGRVGRKKRTVDLEVVKAIPLMKRQTVRSLASHLNMSKITIHRLIREDKLIKRHSNVIKPYLTHYNKIERVEYCLSHLDQVGQFDFMMNEIHLDEKWFSLNKNARRFYLADGEEEPHPTTKSKRFMTKVMFLAAVARPRHDTCRNRLFNGKIGIWPFVFQEPAQRSSRNRPRGTMETKCIQSVDKLEVKKMLKDKVLPSIRETWPTNWACKTSNSIYMHFDNARPHPSEAEFIEDLKKDGFNMSFKFQPANGPYMNVLDLGFFNSIQSLQHQIEQNTIDDLIAATIKAFEDLEVEKLNNTFLTLQQCMIETIKSDGSNKYKVPHLGKGKLVRRGMIPDRLTCLDEVIQHGKRLLHDQNQ